jgi:SsrA-binding protein
MQRNKTVQREFELLEKFEAGIVLSGAEVKSIKSRGMKLDGAHVRVIDGQAYLLSAEVQPYQQAQEEGYDVHRSRKLLLHKKEILKIQIKLSQGSNLTIVPVSWYNKKGNIKIEIALAKGLKTWEKKKIEARKTEKRRVEKEMKEYLKVKE